LSEQKLASATTALDAKGQRAPADTLLAQAAEDDADREVTRR
jgi:hypothetical protein